MKHSLFNRPRIEGLLALLLFGVFAVCALSVLLTGAGAYRRLVARDQQCYDRRTCAQFLATKVRQAPGGMRLTQFGDGTALVFTQSIDGEEYETILYCWDGWLCELFSAADADTKLLPQDGERVLAASQLSAQLEDGLLRIEVSCPDTQPFQLALSLRMEEEALS